MKKTRKQYSAAFKTKVVLEALKERETTSELAQKYSIHPSMITNWKAEFLSKAEHVFDPGNHVGKDAEKEKDELFKQIGQMKVEIDWLKKKLL